MIVIELYGSERQANQQTVRKKHIYTYVTHKTPFPTREVSNIPHRPRKEKKERKKERKKEKLRRKIQPFRKVHPHPTEIQIQLLIHVRKDAPERGIVE